MATSSSGRRRPVMHDIARVAGVSQKTVSRVVNHSADVSEATRAAVNRAIASLGYRPNTTARALVSQRSSMIGIVAFGPAGHGTYANIVGVEQAARSAGYSTLIASTLGGSADEMRVPLQEMLDRGVDGIIVSEPGDDSRLDPSLLRGTPVVSIGSTFETPGQLRVGYDQAAAAQRATQHLLGLGHKSVSHVAGPAGSPIAAARVRGWRSALQIAGAAHADLVVARDWTARAGYEAGRTLMSSERATAIFVAGDHMAFGVMRAVVESRRRIPDDVSVVGFDDIPEAEFQMIPLTTIRQDPQILAMRAVKELVAIISGTPLERGGIDLPLELVVRSSSGPPRHLL